MANEDNYGNVSDCETAQVVPSCVISDKTGNWQTDHQDDFSLINSRLDSFRGSSLAQQVSAERLARAGFYYTGHADRVRCFSCQKTVENWCRGDTPVERHKEVSPSCRFLSCTHRTLFNSIPDNTLTNGSTYNEEAEDMEFRLRTGEVVDETTYPMAPHMSSEEARLQTFTSWPSTAPGRVIRCSVFAVVACWPAGRRETRPGENTPNISPTASSSSGTMWATSHSRAIWRRSLTIGGMQKLMSPMGSFEERLGSFAGVQHPIDPERLARAGFYSTGTGDKALCFRCGGGLKSWQPDEDPWEEHAKYYPGCSFLLAEKGQEFVNHIQLQYPLRNGATSSHQNGFSGDRNEVLRSTMAQKAIELGLEPSVVEKDHLGENQ
ncbi:E3 ubiquitin-protein ligase XIAP [Larimichthys crocea]|uniref:Uncharacterized protein n=1 Tax=Larimichthys crocea TaxID=215358 RepID=A0ACD3RDT5_LARCR|nr:E3 ubiquitin-protein ligase XIAP [Larimichthys crocea]